MPIYREIMRDLLENRLQLESPQNTIFDLLIVNLDKCVRQGVYKYTYSRFLAGYIVSKKTITS